MESRGQTTREASLARQPHQHEPAADWQPQLSLTTVVVPGDPDRLVIRIGDNGGGIPEDLQQKIFKEFFTTKTVEEGTGLGLAISHRIVENHGGTITLRSQVGVGTEFDIALPIVL